MKNFDRFIAASIITFFLVLFSFNSFAQNESDEKKFSDKLFFGGTLGLMFGDVTQVDIVPLAGIWVIA